MGFYPLWASDSCRYKNEEEKKEIGL